MSYILIADDNEKIADVLKEYARKEGFEPIIAYDGQEAIDKFEKYGPEIILLDVMMPKKDGFEICRQIRKKSNVPIIMITARGEDFEKIMGLEIGAEDYIVKPFSPGEVMARIKAILRRISKPDNEGQQVIKHDNLEISLDDYKVTVNNKDVSLTKKEMEILWTLVNNINKVFSRENLLSSLWGYDYYGDSRTVDSHIKRLRSKLDVFPHDNWDIKTIWGVGYKFENRSHEK